MRTSKTGLGITKVDNLDAMFPSQDLMLKTGQLVQYASGVFGLNNIALGVKQNLENIIRDEFYKNDIIEVALPLLHPQSTWERSGRYDGYVNDGTMLTTTTNHGTFCLQPTAEEAIIEFVEGKLTSYKQLPVIVYQMNEKFRNEIRNRGYMFRGKAFTMMDAYSFDETKEGLEKSYLKMKDCYMNVFNKVGLNVLPVAADTGSIGGSKSEEFMLLSPLGEDTILYNSKTKQALNEEILEKENYLEILKTEYNIDSLEGFEKVKSVELGHIFQLGTIYSEKMNSNFMTKEEKKSPYVMGCYGIGITRVVATIFEENAITKNDKVVGYSLPLTVAPFIGSIIASDNKKEIAEEVYAKLTNSNVKIIIDDRYDKKTTFGVKLNDALTYGSPYTFVLGNKVENDEIQIENTKTNNTFVLKIDEFISTAKEVFMTKKSFEEVLGLEF